MRKLAFYPRLALSNLYRNRSTYLPYLLACIVSIVTFYTLLAINTNGALTGLPNATIVQSFTAVGTVILAMFCAVLLFYTNSFLIKRRKKEIGLYTILGMEKRNIGVLMFFETLFIAILALVLGIGGGTLLAKLLFLILLRLVRFPVTLELPISFPAMGITAIFFAVVFFLTLLSNLRQVRIANPIELTAGGKQGEREPKASWLLTLVGVVTLGAGYVLAIRVKSPMEALMMFLLAVVLVIVGTYCLFTSGSVAFLKLLRRNKSYYYNKKHFIPVSGMIYRMKQNAVGLASICILSCMVLVTVSSTISLYAGAEDSVLMRYPHQYKTTMYEQSDGDSVLAGVQELASRNGQTVEGLRDYEYVSTIGDSTVNPFTSTITWNSADEITVFRLVRLEDYNRLEGQSETLAPGEALIFCESGSYPGTSLTLNGVEYALRPAPSFDGRKNNEYKETMGLTITLFLTAQDYDAAIAAIPADAWLTRYGNTPLRREIAFDLAGSAEGAAAFEADMQTFMQGTAFAKDYVYESREEQREGFYFTYGGFLFLGIYFGTLFLLAAAMIIYYKQISEGYDDRERFDIMQKVGMSADEVRHTIQSQIRTVFFLPLAVAVVHILVAFNTVSTAMMAFALTNRVPFMIATAVTILGYCLLYMLVYRRTARAYFRIVRREA